MTDIHSEAEKQPAADRTAARPSLSKVSTGVAGLDSLLHGGLPEGRPTLVTGGAGTGKTVLAMQFLCAGLRNGEPAVMVTFEERAGKLREYSAILGIDLAPEEEAGRLAIIEILPDPTRVLAGTFSLHARLDEVSQRVRSMGAKRIVFDGADAMLRLFDVAGRENTELYSLTQWLIGQDLTLLVTAKIYQEQFTTPRYDFLEFLADCTIHLRQEVEDRVSRLLLRVIKCRGSDFGRYEYPFIVAWKGIHLRPIFEAELRNPPLGPWISSGNVSLDRILGGGYRRSASIMVFGDSGAGKTTFAATFVRAALEHRERVLFVSFELSETDLLDTLRRIGLDLGAADDGDRFRYLGLMPEAEDSERHLHRIVSLIEESGFDHVVLDPVSALSRIGSRANAYWFVVRLIDACKKSSATCFMTNQRAATVEDMPDPRFALSFLVDVKILLRYLQIDGRLQRTLLIPKALGSDHSLRTHAFEITGHGLEIGGPIGQNVPPPGLDGRSRRRSALRRLIAESATVGAAPYSAAAGAGSGAAVGEAPRSIGSGSPGKARSRGVPVTCA